MFGIALLIAIPLTLLAVVPKPLRIAFSACLALRLGIATVNSQLESGLIGSTLDAIEFQRRIAILATAPEQMRWSGGLLSSGSGVFLQGYAFILAALGIPTSRLGAHLISAGAAALCLVLLAQCCLLIAPEQWQFTRRVLIAYTLIPSLLANQSYVLREAWQSLAVLLVLHAALTWRMSGFAPRLPAELTLGLAIGASMHSALGPSMLIVAALGLVLALDLRPTALVARPIAVFGAALMAVILVGVGLTLLTQSNRFQAFTTGSGFSSEAASFLDGAERAAAAGRASYGPQWVPTQPWTMIRALGAYLMLPLPTQARTLPDLVLMGENLLRLAIVVKWLRRRRQLTALRRSIAAVMMSMWLAIELIWSLGTVNWGTAARHHAMGYGVILMIGVLVSRRVPHHSTSEPSESVRSLGKTNESEAQWQA